MIPLARHDEELRVEWRENEMSEWQKGEPHRFGEATAQFLVKVEREICPADYDHVTVCAAVRGHPSAWRLELPPWNLGSSGPEVIRVKGVSCCAGLGQVLRGSWEFVSSGEGLVVVNEGPSKAALLPVDQAIPGVMPMQAPFFVSNGRLSDEEIEVLRKEVDQCPG